MKLLKGSGASSQMTHTVRYVISTEKLTVRSGQDIRVACPGSQLEESLSRTRPICRWNPENDTLRNTTQLRVHIKTFEYSEEGGGGGVSRRDRIRTQRKHEQIRNTFRIKL